MIKFSCISDCIDQCTVTKQNSEHLVINDSFADQIEADFAIQAAEISLVPLTYWSTLTRFLDLAARSDLCSNINRCLASVFKQLRNAIANALDDRSVILHHMPDPTGNVIVAYAEKMSHQSLSEEYLVTMRCALQTLGNLSVGNNINKSVIWKCTFLELSSVFIKLLMSEDAKVSKYTAFIVHNCSVSSTDKVIMEFPERLDLINALVKSVYMHDNEWSLFILEDICQSIKLADIYVSLSELSRTYFLDHISDEIDRDNLIIPEIFVKLIVDRFTNALNDIISGRDVQNPIEICKTVRFLAVTVMFPVGSFFKTDSMVLLLALEGLRCVHRCTKEGKDGFDRRQSLDDLSGKNKTIAEHPFFGFKRDLVRLIANMVNDYKPHQDFVRENDGILLLLDMSSLDARNPLITEWVVLAIRNLTKGNVMNQEVVASVARRGEIVNSPLLQDLGMQFASETKSST